MGLFQFNDVFIEYFRLGPVLAPTGARGEKPGAFSPFFPPVFSRFSPSSPDIFSLRFVGGADGTPGCSYSEPGRASLPA